MAVTNTWTNPTALDRNTGQTIREQDWDGVLSDLMVLGGTTGSSGVNKYQLLTNGGFEIWQRGNGPFTANAANTADRWAIVLVGGDTVSISRDTANADGSLACAACTSTHAAGSALLVQFVGRPGDGLEQLRNRTLTFSVRVRTSTPNAVQPYISPDGNATVTNGAFHSGGGTYETLTVTVSLGAATSVVAGIAFRLSCTAYLDNAMLVVGNVAADYAPLHPADDLARCLRYYEIIGESTTTVAYSAYGTAGGVIQFAIPYKARKAVAPTATKVGTWTLSNCAQPTVGGGLDALYIQSNVTALGMAQFYNGSAGNNITLESNP